MTLAPTPIIRLFRFLNWVTNPVNETMLFMHRARIERDANKIMRIIGSCTTPEHILSVNNLIFGFMERFGGTPQIVGWVLAFRRERDKKDAEILSQMQF